MRDEAFAECRDTGNFDKFVRETKGDWGRIVTNLTKKYRIPPSIDEHDILQIVWTACYKYINDWEPSKGLPLATYVQNRTIDRAIKFIASSRGNVGAGGCNRNRAPTYDLCFSGFGDGDSNFDVLFVDPEQLNQAQRKQMLQKYKGLETVFETFIQTGCFSKTARKALQTQAAREKWFVTKMGTAKAIVKKNLHIAVDNHV